MAAVFLILGTATIQAAMTSQSGYEIWGDVISDGGSEGSSSTNYTVSDTIGQQSQFSSSTNYGGGFGFRYLTRDALTLTLGSASIDFGELSIAATQTASHTLTLGTTAEGGASVTVAGTTLMNGSDSIDPIGNVSALPAAGTSQFGLNAEYQSGTAPIASAQSPYDDPTRFAYQSGDEIIAASNPVHLTTFDINYIANIDGTEPAGDYSTTLTYTATATF
ncbi:MAG: hypothetical protein KBB55_01125 [Candidatus Buchananbacteria bacterium]|nr:hypothetical protein [Candidatus Buchananbacteria bacterium]